MGTTITRKFTFDSGHRVYGHESKCAHLHGHTYHIELEFYAQALDSLGRIVDFSQIKDVCKGWIDENLDHGMIMFGKDPLAELLQKEGQKVYVMDVNPTAENIAAHIYNVLTNHLETKLPGVYVTSVKIHETPNCSATYKFP